MEDTKCSFYKKCFIRGSGCTVDFMNSCGLAKEGKFLGHCSICGQKVAVKINENGLAVCENCQKGFIDPRQNIIKNAAQSYA